MAMAKASCSYTTITTSAKQTARMAMSLKHSLQSHASMIQARPALKMLTHILRISLLLRHDLVATLLMAIHVHCGRLSKQTRFPSLAKVRDPLL